MNVKGTGEKEGATVGKLGRTIKPESGKRVLTVAHVRGTKHGPGEGLEGQRRSRAARPDDCVYATLGHGRETRRDGRRARASQWWPEHSLPWFMTNSMPVQERMETENFRPRMVQMLLKASLRGLPHSAQPRLLTLPPSCANSTADFQGRFFVF